MAKIIAGSVDSVPGFKAIGVKCGIKSGEGPDLGVVVCETECNAAAVFTTNRVKAAPVSYCRGVLESHADRIRGVVVNSGNANACTGERGLRDAAETAAAAERALGLKESSVLVMSTGVIGHHLPLEKIRAGLAEAGRKIASGELGGFSRAIMTTDLKEKALAVELSVRGVPVRIGAAAKGSGMIHPNMATMLAFFTTDAAVSAPALSLLLRRVVGRTFNMISVDGDRSPNDSVFLLASGTSGAPIVEGPDSPGFDELYEALLAVSETLARMIAADGEGATKLVELRIRGADSFESAETVARAIANSPLVKTALFGSDPNWGRIICAAGYSGAPVDPARIDIFFGDCQAVAAGAPAATERSLLAAELHKSEVVITLDLHQGPHDCRFWTCDFSYDYVRINAEYHT
jgi:glutamate N-acetyltransferase / amino-acid N-acetyltransferase